MDPRCRRRAEPIRARATPLDEKVFSFGTPHSRISGIQIPPSCSRNRVQGKEVCGNF
jgi:hypothetical protein